MHSTNFLNPNISPIYPQTQQPLIPPANNLQDPFKTLVHHQQLNNNNNINNQIGVQQFNLANSPLSQQQLLNHNKLIQNYMLSAITTLQNNNSPQNQATFHSLLKHFSNTMSPFIPRPNMIPPPPAPVHPGLLPHQNNHQQFLKHHFEYLMNQQKRQHLEDLSMKKSSENSSLSSELSSSSSSSTNSCPITSDSNYESNNQTSSSNIFNIDEIDNSTKNIINEIKQASKMRNCRKKIKKNSTPNKLEEEKIVIKEEDVEIDVDYVEDDDSLNDSCYNDQNENDHDQLNKLEAVLTDEEDSEQNNEDENRKKKLSSNNSSVSPTPFMFSSMRHYSISNKSSSSASSISSVLSNGKDNSSSSIKPFKHSIDFILGMEESRQSKRKQHDLELDEKSNNNLSDDEENYSLKKSN